LPSDNPGLAGRIDLALHHRIPSPLRWKGSLSCSIPQTEERN
jgi:hypothetical protein